MTIRLIAGIRPLDPLNTMGVLRDVLRACGHQAELVCYGYAFVPLTNTIATNAVLAATQPGTTGTGARKGSSASASSSTRRLPSVRGAMTDGLTAIVNTHLSLSHPQVSRGQS